MPVNRLQLALSVTTVQHFEVNKVNFHTNPFLTHIFLPKEACLLGYLLHRYLCN